MTVSHLDFLNFAKTSLVANPTEFCSRNAASRAYYAAFHCCYSMRSHCPELKDEEIKGSHVKLYKRFQNLPMSEPGAALLKKMAYLALMMKEIREFADYRVNKEFNNQDALQQISDAEKVAASWKTLQTI